MFHIRTLVIVHCPSPNSSQPSFYFFHYVTLDQKLSGGTCTTGSHTGQWEASLGAGNVTMKDNTSSQIILCVCGLTILIAHSMHSVKVISCTKVCTILGTKRGLSRWNKGTKWSVHKQLWI